jgi:AmmeMemoRadiSam system protein B/AmmeMemoRadiSam system protein A
MPNKKRVWIWFFVLLCLFAPEVLAGEETTRHPFVSGAFYPSHSSELSGMVERFLAKASLRKESQNTPITALIVPHAGYVYSGQSAAAAYKQLKGHFFDTVILVGVYHRANFEGASIWKEGVWRTPLGEVPVDEEMAAAIAGENPLFGFTQDVHLAEHSLEVQVPFLQKTLKNFKLVPIAISRPSLREIQSLAAAIVKHSQGKRVLWIASTDLSHYRSQRDAARMDKRALKIIRQGDVRGLLKEALSERVELCGLAATMTVLEAARLKGAGPIKILDYATSAKASGDKTRVVGYGSAVIYGGWKTEAAFTAEPKTAFQDRLDKDQQQVLLDFSRQTLESHVLGRTLPKLEIKDPELQKSRAVFVTLRKHGELRGCIGSLLPQEPLVQAVQNMTVQSASQDPRFKPVAPPELADLSVEISVLSLPRKIQSADEIVLGRHGVIVKRDGRSGVFLPQVATETGWTKEEFLNELCSQKAGIPPDAWKDPATELYVFTVQDFGEKTGF